HHDQRQSAHRVCWRLHLSGRRKTRRFRCCLLVRHGVILGSPSLVNGHPYDADYATLVPPVLANREHARRRQAAATPKTTGDSVASPDATAGQLQPAMLLPSRSTLAKRCSLLSVRYWSRL